MHFDAPCLYAIIPLYVVIPLFTAIPVPLIVVFRGTQADSRFFKLEANTYYLIPTFKRGLENE